VGVADALPGLCAALVCCLLVLLMLLVLLVFAGVASVCWWCFAWDAAFCLAACLHAGSSHKNNKKTQTNILHTKKIGVVSGQQ
jgi:hypothetical protein